MSAEESNSPRGELLTKTMTMPKDTNSHGDIFGGWLLSQMDIAGAILANAETKHKTVTVGIDRMSFHEPVYVGDILCCRGKVKKIGRTSITILVEAWVKRDFSAATIKVTEGLFTYVATDGKGVPIPFND